MKIREGTQRIENGTKQAIIEFVFIDYIIYVFQGTLSQFDIVIKYRKGGKRIRTPKHIHWVVDILMKMQGNETLTKRYLEAIQNCWNTCVPLANNDYDTLRALIESGEKEIDIEQYFDLNAYGEYDVEFLYVLMELLAVQDMYILISSNKPIGDLHDAYNEIRNEYSSILKIYGLALNTKKCCFKESKEINLELKKSLYDEYFNGQKHNIEELFSGTLYRFLNDLSVELLFDSIDIERYNELINAHFSSKDIEFTPSEVFNYFVYEDENELKSEPVVKKLVGLVERSISFISLDPKRLTVMIMKTQSDRAIKGFLNQLFRKNRSGRWNSYDTAIAISYLIQSEFRHKDLLDILSKRHPNLYSYYSHHCKSSTIHCFDLWRIKELAQIIAQDSKAHYLYFMYLCEMKRANYMAAFAYYKNYFDRVTADLDFAAGNDPRLKKPNYNMFYREGTLIRFYSGIDDGKTVIEKAHKLRNANPLSHASSELLDSNNTSKDLCESIKALSALIYGYIDKHKEQP